VQTVGSSGAIKISKATTTMSNVLITGCSSGFGLLTAQTFARRGDQVFATVRDLSTAGALREVRDAEELPISILQLDVRDAASVHSAVSATLDSGPIDVLVNNAGYAFRAAVEEMDDDELLQQFDTNVFGIVRLVRAVAPAMRAHGSGVIVNVSSIVSSAALPFSGAYSASKAAVNLMTESLHYELAPFGVRVAVVEPGPYPTTRFLPNSVAGRNATASSPYADVRASYQSTLSRIVASGPADPQEVADAIYEAVYGDIPRFRYVVGRSAQQIAEKRQSSDFEDFERFLRSMLDWWVGARDASSRAAALPGVRGGGV
jgi:NAD(P)-dependent dehydrogenase (short-subunit alcohol dehydrogenase family)